VVAGVLASLAELELELGKERRTAAREARRARANRSVARKLSIRRKLLWRSGCTPAARAHQPSPPR
jgi:hypothetical protein